MNKKTDYDQELLIQVSKCVLNQTDLDLRTYIDVVDYINDVLTKPKRPHVVLVTEDHYEEWVKDNVKTSINGWFLMQNQRREKLEQDSKRATKELDKLVEQE